MARTDNLTNFLTDVASAIRTKGGTSSQIPASDFDTAIANLPGADIDWSYIGISNTPPGIIEGYNYAKQIKDTWYPVQDMYWLYRQDRDLMFFPTVDTTRVTDLGECFNQCTSLIQVADLDFSSLNNMSFAFLGCSALRTVGNFYHTGNVTNFFRTFYNCIQLRDVPVFDMSSATELSGMFYNCNKLTHQSIDNIMQSCVSATSYQGQKTLTVMDIYSNIISTEEAQQLPHYQDFINAGWTLGF